MCAGPWRPIRLEIYSSRIEDLWSDIVVEKDLKLAFGTLFATVEGSADSVRFSLKLENCTILEKTVAAGSNGLASSKIQIAEPALWFPHGYGGQPLYTLTAEVFAEGVVLDTMTKKIGLRRAELIQNEDDIGRSFYFRVNNVDVFCGGSCWIPADSFIPRISNDRYRRWLQMMVDGGQVMTRYASYLLCAPRCHFLHTAMRLTYLCRVWGGGIYEEDVFYDLCDKLGILVWQDFMFGCGSYPTWPELLESIHREATCNIRRLRHHPSIVIYAGNNEDYQVAELHELEYNPNDNDP
jgi:beta-mannosidase